MQIEGEKVKVMTDFLFLCAKVTEDGDCSHEIRRWLLLGRKAMTKLDSVLKSRDFTANKAPYSQGYVFPVIMDGCESWTVKKAECQRIDAFKLWCWKRLLKVPWAPKNWCLQTVVLEKTPEIPAGSKEIKPVNLKRDQPWISLEGLILKLKLQYIGHLMWTHDSLEKFLMLGKIEGRRRGH